VYQAPAPPPVSVQPEVAPPGFFEEPTPEAPPIVTRQEEPVLPFDDLEVPAVLRRGRQLFQ
jgi:hypothetical protein